MTNINVDTACINIFKNFLKTTTTKHAFSKFSIVRLGKIKSVKFLEEIRKIIFKYVRL